MRPVKSGFRAVLGLLTLQGLLATSSLAQNIAEVDAPGTVAAQERIDEAVYAQALVDRDAYQQSINALEARQGVYTMELSEAYVGLGTTLRKLDMHEEAAEAFGKALQSLRIGYGLNDLRQVPVIQELRTTQERLGNWEEVHAANFLIYNIARHSAEASADLRVQSLLDLGRWVRRANAAELVSDFDANARSLSALYNSEIERIELAESYDGRSTHLASLYLELAANELSEAKRKYEMPITAFEIPGIGEQRIRVSQQCFSGVDRNGRPMTVCNAPVETPNMNYYLNPNVQKSTEIRKHLVEVENRVLQAYRTLQEDPSDSAQQAALRTEVQRLSSEYNAFVDENRNQATPLR